MRRKTNGKGRTLGCCTGETQQQLTSTPCLNLAIKVYKFWRPSREPKLTISYERNCLERSRGNDNCPKQLSGLLLLLFDQAGFIKGLKADADLLQQCTHIDAHLKDSHSPGIYHRFFWWAQGCETGPTVYHPYPRRLETLIVCRYHYIGNNFSSCHLIETFSGAWPGSEPVASC